MKVNSITDLAPSVKDYTIMNSATGEEFIIPLRDLMPEQLADLNRRVERPRPPIKKGDAGFKKNPITGSIEPQYDFEDPDYRYQKELADYNFVREFLIESLNLPIPGETHEEKLESLRKNIPFWALLELKHRLDEVNGLSPSDVALEKKASKRKQEA